MPVDYVPLLTTISPLDELDPNLKNWVYFNHDKAHGTGPNVVLMKTCEIWAVAPLVGKFGVGARTMNKNKIYFLFGKLF